MHAALNQVIKYIINVLFNINNNNKLNNVYVWTIFWHMTLFYAYIVESISRDSLQIHRCFLEYGTYFRIFGSGSCQFPHEVFSHCILSACQSN